MLILREKLSIGAADAKNAIQDVKVEDVVYQGTNLRVRLSARPAFDVHLPRCIHRTR